MKKLSPILKALMAEIRISESELARRTGVGQPVIHRIASGETDNPKVATLSPIANFFALSISQLIGDEPLPENRLPGTFNPGTHGWMQVPLLSWEQLLEWPNLKDQKTNFKPTESISTDFHLSENAYALRVKDNTMEPRFPEGMLIIVEPALQPENRDFAIAQVEGQKLPTFKQLFLDGNAPYLKPVNPDFKAFSLDKKHRFLGVVVQSRMDFKKL
jgi:SOS-response transcriptional repressor LexA